MVPYGTCCKLFRGRYTQQLANRLSIGEAGLKSKEHTKKGKEIHQSAKKADQGHIQVCFHSIQPLWVPKKTAQIFLQVQINNRIFH